MALRRGLSSPTCDASWRAGPRASGVDDTRQGAENCQDPRSPFLFSSLGVLAGYRTPCSSARRRKVGDVPLLEAARLLDDALKDALGHGGRQRRRGRARDTLEQLALARRVVDIEAEATFHLAHAHHQAQPLREQLHHLPIELVDRLPQLRDAWGHARNLPGAALQQQPRGLGSSRLR